MSERRVRGGRSGSGLGSRPVRPEPTTRRQYPSIPVAGGDTAAPHNLKKRLSLIADALPLAAARVLDGGCGAGEYVVALAQCGAVAEGVEYLPEKIAAWKARHPNDPRVRQGDLMCLPYHAGSFDAVILNEVLEHVPDDRAALREAWRVLRPGGTLVVFSPNRWYPFESHGLDSYRTGRRISPTRTFCFPWLPLAVATRLARPWARNYWPRELRALIRQAGFSITSTTFVWQTFENIGGAQGPALRALAPLLRLVANALERVPLLRGFGTSQVVVAIRPVGPGGQ